MCCAEEQPVRVQITEGARETMSNFPRLALQMRVQVPRLRLPGSYLALDDRPWCSRSSCREGFASAHEHELSTRRELWRNPPIPASFEF